ncbi:MAG: D-alanine--D-alanine ligase family protein [Candidatus Nanopelagicales bacterium]|nr:D-alanine--D-alanine ligase family protein [Candidatus Nanopelagicales bacterium]MDZ4250880.1 D-alanine--D-alanine ligase family protein [Candidatus Nanopelagicales bacterium]
MRTPRARVAVLFGGRSSEHAISCVSAGGILKAIDRTIYDVVPIGITPSGQWVRESDNADRLAIIDGVLPSVAPDGHRAILSLDHSTRGIWFETPGGERQFEAVDVVFPVLHGANGEDGTIQGVFEIAGLPYVGSGVFASAACMDKGHAKPLLASQGIPVGSWYAFHARSWAVAPEQMLDRISQLGMPLFVKPSRAGSSVGVSKAHDQQELVSAIELALRHDPRVIVEAAVEGAREIECGVLVGPDGVARASVCAEIRVREGHEFYDFGAKYLDDSAELIVPARLPGQVEKTVQDLALQAFAVMGCEGLARVDFFVGADGRVVLNELNTMPGFTPISMYPRMWAASGVEYADLIDTLIQEALSRSPGLR